MKTRGGLPPGERLGNEDVDSDALIRLAGTTRRSLAGISAKAAEKKPAGPTLAEYMANKSAERADLDGEDI